jgi:hypothetical protein
MSLGSPPVQDSGDPANRADLVAWGVCIPKLHPFQPNEGQHEHPFQPDEGQHEHPFQPDEGQHEHPFQPDEGQHEHPFQPNEGQQPNPSLSDEEGSLWSPSSPLNFNIDEVHGVLMITSNLTLEQLDGAD